MASAWFTAVPIDQDLRLMSTKFDSTCLSHDGRSDLPARQRKTELDGRRSAGASTSNRTVSKLRLCGCRPSCMVRLKAVRWQTAHPRHRHWCGSRRLSRAAWRRRDGRPGDGSGRSGPSFEHPICFRTASPYGLQSGQNAAFQMPGPSQATWRDVHGNGPRSAAQLRSRSVRPWNTMI